MLALQHLHDAQRLCMSNTWPITLFAVESWSRHGVPS